MTKSEKEFYDPLTFNLYGQTKRLLSQIPAHDPHANAISSSSSISELLDNLSRLLAFPSYTQNIANYFRPILFDLCARWLYHPIDPENELQALCLLLEVHEELFPILLGILQKPPFQKGPLQFVTDASLHEVDSKRLQQLLLVYYRILQANRELPHQLFWSLRPLQKIANESRLESSARLLAIRCYALQSGMGEVERETWEKEVFGDLYGVDCSLYYGDHQDGSPAQVDGWLMPVIELERTRSARNALVSESQNYYDFSLDDAVKPLTSSDLCPLVANIHGVLLLRTTPSSNTSSPLIPTSTAIHALRSLALHLSIRLPVLLTSPASSGKSLLLSHLAHTLLPNSTNQLVFIHLADTSLDPRSLLGSHVSSQKNPGAFEWKDGVLVRAMKEGKWVVFKDIDRGSNEVLGLVKPLIESMGLGKWIGGRASLEVPSRGKVVAADSFAVFATRSVVLGRNGVFPNPVFFGAHKFHEITVSSPSINELRTIIDTRFPRLAGHACNGLIRLWDRVKALGTGASTRDVGLRELEKLCVRVEKIIPSTHQLIDVVSSAEDEIPLPLIYPSTVLREEIFLNARDIFFGSGGSSAAARARIDEIARTVGELLGLDTDRQQWLLTRWVPEFSLETDANGRTTAVRVGRTQLLARPTKLEIVPAWRRPFAMHRPATLLMSRIATAVSLGEQILLTGETGTGKTSVITHLAHTLHQPLISLNLSHQTEASDLIGGFRPLDARIPASTLQERFLELFGETFSRRKNEKFESEARKAVTQAKWKRAVGLWKESIRLAKARIQSKQKEAQDEELDSQTPRKRRKLDVASLNASEVKWCAFERDINEFDAQHVHGRGNFAFDFVEGPLVKALRSGDWVLLDEINLASPDTLECISSILRSPTASITLTEQGSLEPVPRHPNFRLFACMNPATDVGKKDLPPNIRTCFTEIDVPPPDSDRETLLHIITQYIGPSAVGDKATIMNVAEFYLAVKDLAESRKIADGSNHRPHYSMRTLARALTFAADIAGLYGLRRAVWEGCLMAFTMVLDAPSTELVTVVAQKHLLAGVKNPRSLLAKEPSVPPTRSADEFVKFGPFYLEKGPLSPDLAADYIMTPSVEAKLIDLARIILTRRFPVLIEGPTSSGKTSSVEYLAKRTGHKFIRINNHEHTDIQEYLGSYLPHPTTGKLEFTDGLLVRALRNGDWIVLDELNLAPTDVLEALNRLLDDNRELVIPETGEVVKPHPNFMLFATQNPPGLYAGRKVLSRAFRNRFLEVHFEDVPEAELETILCQRCQIAPSYGKKIISVFRELQKRRQSSRVFESKHGFATLRDLFRWAGRDAIGYQELAENGYMLLAERARREDDKSVVKEVIESVMGVRIDEDALYELQNPQINFNQFLDCPIPKASNLIWTKSMQRLFILVTRALRFNEPVLLVGETGSGKTSICQVFADATSRRLYTLNCHQNTETADIIGGLRPVRNRGVIEAELLHDAGSILATAGVHPDSLNIESLSSLLESSFPSEALDPALSFQIDGLRRKLGRVKSVFEWHDGPLVQAMRKGDVFLLDEISLADDSVLERLNSVLEPSRSLVLAERGGDDFLHPSIHAHELFKLVATMNPGGDYGKKELSPALRNRFTEIWVPSINNRSDLELIVASTWKHATLHPFTGPLLDFVDWLSKESKDQSFLNLRDILGWVEFSNAACRSDMTDGERMPADEIFHHAAHMTYLDGLASVASLSSYSQDSLNGLKAAARAQLHKLVPVDDSEAYVPIHDPSMFFQLGSFSIPRGPQHSPLQTFNLQAPTTQDNAMRVIRACQLHKPILLEGSPGVGKTSLVTALSRISGYELCRINLSDQTDLIDLFGSDLPVEGGGPGEFVWKDGEFLRALQEGRWVLLDEMNLAPQAILEGLNAVLDHRGSVYIPELGRTFTKHPSFRIFAAQNPLSQGGGRKGLPKSFLNRFTKVYVDELSASDLLLVCQHLHPDIDPDILRAMISFNSSLNHAVSVQRIFAKEGTPWEFNLRDVLRWASLLLRPPHSHLHPVDHFRTVYLERFRNLDDRRHAEAMFNHIFNISYDHTGASPWTISSSQLHIGHFATSRQNFSALSHSTRLLKWQLPALEALGSCVSISWLSIITGARNSGKTALVRTLANLTGHSLYEISINQATDTMDLLGGFEQSELYNRLMALIGDMITLLEQVARTRDARILPDLEDLLDLRHRLSHEPTPNLTTAILVLSRIVDAISVSDPSTSSYLTSVRRKVKEIIHHSDGTGRFEWVDGPLVRALKEGHWLLLDGANLCNPSILDRLNSLCESDGSLILSERGFVNGKVEKLMPHLNFRLFMTVDPQYGELSRAMRNRGIEIALIPRPSLDDLNILRHHYRLPAALDCSKDLLPTEFVGLCRGIYRGDETQLHTVQTSGHALDHYSSLSTLLDRAPMLMTHDSMLSKDEALLHFLSRAISPIALSLFRRFLNMTRPSSRATAESESPVRHILERSVVAVSCFRGEYSKSYGVPLSHTLAHPIDFFLDSQFFDPSLQSAHRTLLKVLQLTVCITLHESLPELGSRIPINHTPEVERRHRVNLGAHSLTREIYGASSAVLDQLVATRFHSDVAIGFPFDLLEYSRYLRDIISQKVLDYSAIQAVSGWIADAVQQLPAEFSPLRLCAEALQEITAPSSGLGLTQIWTSFLDIGRFETTEEVERLENLAKRNLHSPNFRAQVLNLMSVNALPQAPSDEACPASAITRELERRVPEKSSEYGTYSTNTRLSHVIALLGLIAHSGRPLGQISRSTIEEVIRISCNYPICSLRSAVAYQHLLWLQDSEASSKILTELQLEWMKAIWNCDSATGEDGPAILFRPSQLSVTLSIWDWSTTSMLDLNDYENTLHLHAQLLLLSCESGKSKVEQLESLLKLSVLKIASCFVTSIKDTNSEYWWKDQIQAFTRLDSTSQVLHFVQEIDNPVFRNAVMRHLQPVFTDQYVDLEDEFANMAHLGMCWIAVGKLFLDLFIPDVPIDPVATQDCFRRFWEGREASYSVQILLHSKLEELTTGNLDNDTISFLQLCMDDATNRLGGVRKISIVRNVSRLQTYWSEVLQFRDQVLLPSKLDSLLQLLKSGDDAAFLREEVLQKSIEGFLQRMQTAYREYCDLIVPIQYALLHIRIGMRIVKQSHRVLSSANPLALALTAFPTMRSTDMLLAIPDSDLKSGISAFQYVLLAIAAVALEASAGIHTEAQMKIVETAYEQALRLWSIDRAKEAEQQKESESLYRQNRTDHHAMTDAEIEEEDFLQLFPSFESVLSPDQEPTVQAKSSSVTHLIPEAEMFHFVQLHGALFAEKAMMDPSAALHEIRMHILPTFLFAQASSLSESVDRNSLPFQLFLLDGKAIELQDPTRRQKKTYDFYVDANLPQIRKAAAVVAQLKQRLEGLIQDWPDQMVLHHLGSLCDAVLALSLRSPVAKVLAALEHLLLKSEDWEIYANRDNTLKSHRAALTELIVEWRRLELSCWQGLLETQLRSFENGISSWWFRLYDCVIRSPMDILQRDTVEGMETLTSHLSSLIPLLNSFIRDSPLGQFQARMLLLRSFEVLCCSFSSASSGSRAAVLERVRCIVHATVEHFALFSTTLTTHLASERSSLEVEVQNLIKLASWKDINVHALKQSAQRTHHRLYGIVRKFREVLRQPVSDRLQVPLAGVLDVEPPQFGFTEEKRIRQTPDFPSNSSDNVQGVPAYLFNIQRTYTRFEDIVVNRIIPFITSTAGCTADTLAVDIITFTKDLASISIPSSLPPDKREKQQKALVVRKKKAWSDLLKELKKAGFSSRLKPEVQRQNESLQWITEQPILLALTDSCPFHMKGEIYFRRLIGLLPDLRAAVLSHHSDLTTREIQRGMSFLESIFSEAVDSRARLAKASSSYLRLRNHLTRAQALASTDRIPFYGTDMLQQITHLFHALLKLTSTLIEIQNALESISHLSSSPQVSPVLIDELQGLLSTSTVFRDRLSQVLEGVKLSAFPVLLEDEHGLAIEVYRHLEQTIQAIRQWSRIEPRLNSHLSPVTEWLQSRLTFSLRSNTNDDAPGLENTDSIINACLTEVQTLNAKCSSPAPAEDDRDNYIRDDYFGIRDFSSLFRIDGILAQLNDSFIDLATRSQDHSADVKKYLPFLQLYTEMVQRQLTAHAQWTKGLFKLSYVLCTVMHTLVKEGFCKPPDTNEDGEADDNTAGMADGVGMGEGSGTNNVSNEIEEESQVEGLKGDDAEGNEPQEKEDGDAIEMSEDFGGEMQDVPDDGSNEGESDAESNTDPEEQVEDLDASDPAAVDEKFWGDEKGPDDPDQSDEKTNEDRSKEQKGGESDVVAKEGKQKSDSKDKKEREEDGEEPAPNAEDEAVEESGEGDENDSPDVNGAPMDEHVPEADTLDLPENLDFGGADEDVAENMEIEEDDDVPAEPDDLGMDSEEPRHEPNEDVDMQDEPAEETNEDSEAAPLAQADKPEGEAEDTEDASASAKPDITSGGGLSSEESADAEMGQEAQGTEAGTSTGPSTGQTQELTTAEQSMEHERSDDTEDTQAQNETSVENSQASGTKSAGVQQGRQPKETTQLMNNPLRSLGDALKEVQQRFDEILNGEQSDVPQEQLGVGEETGPVEYLSPEDVDHDMQALGPAQEEQVAKLKELKLMEPESTDLSSETPMDIDLPLQPETHQPAPSRDRPSQTEKNGAAQHDDIEGAVARTELQTSSERSEAVMDLDGPKADVELEDVETSNVEAELRVWQSAGLPDSGADHIWRLYESLTQDLAYALCEQLRLILEPSLATRLKGDYRTGKRLNMKKIISYIASDYTKDKIWLRRTRPSQREYQVLIALDDSRSMAESHSVHLAYQTLALVSKALNRLEAGDIGIAKFGETVELLHGFDGVPFNDQAGIEVIKAFHFNQKATNVLSLVDTSLRVLEAARDRRSTSSSTSADLWQLEIIISDGMCQDHDKLRSVLRKAEEQRVMIVFIIIDSLHSSAPGAGSSSQGAQGSILSMEKAEFKTVDGRMELQLQRYLDSFPFEYYVVLRNVEALPDVLSATLKQFFERISEE